MTDKKKLEAIIADIQSSDLKLAKSGIEKFRKDGQSDAIPEFAIAITQNENPEILELGKQLLFDVKDENAIQGIFKAINHPQLKNHSALLISVLWEAGIDCKDRLEDLIQLVIKGDSTITLEVLTVIENIDNSYPYDEIIDHKLTLTEEIESCDDEIKKQLMLSLCEVLDSMTE